MSGIAGIVCKNPNKIAKNIFYANNQMRKRGPHDEGYILINEKDIDICYGEDTPMDSFEQKHNYYPSKDIKSTFENSYNIAFSQRRLATFDLSTNAHQPMCDESNRYWIVANSAVYNYEEIRIELEKLGHKFISNSDSEVILKSYIQWKEKCLHKFNGDFVFCIYDCLKNKLFIARDRMGVKPLYYTFCEGRFIFASDIKTIIASKLYEPKIDKEGLYYNFIYSITIRPQTSFKNVFGFKQGHYAVVDCKTLEYKECEYWDIPTGIQDFSMREDDAIQMVEEELFRSIRYRLKGDLEIGSHLSGGIDSGTITAMASKLKPNIKAFTLEYDKMHTAYNEVEEAKETAQLNDINHICHLVTTNDFKNEIKNMVLEYEEPFISLAATYLISKVAKQNGVNVLFSGLGAEEPFAEYHPPIFNIDFKAQMSDKYNSIYQFLAFKLSNFSDDRAQRLFKGRFDSLNYFENYFKDLKKDFCDDVEMYNYIHFKTKFNSHYTYRTDLHSMHHSIETRYPYLDHSLLEKVATIPTKYKLNVGVSKYVLRKVAQKYIAPRCLMMQKKGMSMPMLHWFDNELKDITHSSINALKNRNFLDSNEIDFIVKSQGRSSQKWILVLFELWLQNFIDEVKF